MGANHLSHQAGENAGIRTHVIPTKAPPAANAGESAATNWRTDAALLLLLALPFVELIAVTVLFDTAALRSRGGWLTALVEQSASKAPRFLMAAGASFVLLSLANASARWREFRVLAADRSRRMLRLVLHAGCFGAFVALSWAMFRGGASVKWALFPWMLLASATLVSYGLAVMSGSGWFALAKRNTRTLLIAAAMGLSLVIVAGQSEKRIGGMSDLTFGFVKAALSALYDNPHVDLPNRTIGSQQFQVKIDPACSGIEGISLILVLLTAFLITFRRRLRFPAALVILPIGVAAIWLLNIVRVVALVAIGTHWSEEVARQGFHSQAGWLFFCAVSLALSFGALHSPLLSRTEEKSPVEALGPTGAYLLPLMALIASQMVSGALIVDFDWPYPLRVVIVAVVLLLLWQHYPSPSFSWTAAAIGLAAFVVWMLLEPAAPAGHTKATVALVDLDRSRRWAWIFFRVIGSCVTVPLAEELALRGYLARRMVSPRFEQVTGKELGWVPLIFSSIAFGALHGRWLAGFAVGMMYGLALRRRGCVWDAIVAHAVTNACVAAAVLLTDRWSLWGGV